MTDAEKEKKFLELMTSYKNQIYRVCWGFSKNPQDIEDLFQETILNVWKGIDGFQGKSSPATWIYRITVNTCILWKKKITPLEDMETNTLVDSPTQDTEFEVEQNPRILQLRAAIQQLKKVDRSLILLVLEGFSYKEIAEISGISVSNVGAKLTRIKAKIKQLIQ